MRRELLNEIFKKYPLLGNIDKLLELNVIELRQIICADNLEDAREVFKDIIENKELCNDNSDKIVKKNVLSNNTIYYMDY